MGTNPKWWAKGLLFENCNCQVVCPGHVHFEQLCTFERCVGYWAIHFEDGEFGGIPLAGVNAVVLYDTPQHMISGNWTEAILIDEQASADQRKSIEAIFSGAAGGPWAVLARFVSKRLATRFVPIEIEDLGTTKRGDRRWPARVLHRGDPRPGQDDPGHLREYVQPDPSPLPGDRPGRRPLRRRGDCDPQ